MCVFRGAVVGGDEEGRRSRRSRRRRSRSRRRSRRRRRRRGMSSCALWGVMCVASLVRSSDCSKHSTKRFAYIYRTHILKCTKRANRRLLSLLLPNPFG